MDKIERDFEYEQKIEDIADKLELLILTAMSQVLDSLMQAYRPDCEQYRSGRQDCNQNTQNDDTDWPF